MPSKSNALVLEAGISPRGWHRLQLAAECLQKFAWTYEIPEGMRPSVGKPSPALAKGSLVHLAMAHHYTRMKAVQEGYDPENWCEPMEAVELMARLNGNVDLVPLIGRVYSFYTAHYPDEIDNIKVREVETLHSTWMGGRYLLTGRLDLVIEDMSGRVFGVDHKTSARILSAQKEFYAVSGQLLGYSHMVKKDYGEAFAGFKLNLIQVSDESRFERVDLARSPFLEAKFERHVVDIEESIEKLKSEERDYDDWPKAMSELVCGTRYGACPFIDWCRFGCGSKKAGNFAVCFGG